MTLRKSDFLYQCQYVAAQTPRLFSLQDFNPVTPTYGCFHYAFWRDKTSEFADARFQEAGATFAFQLLAEVQDVQGFQASTETLKRRVAAALSFWKKIQHTDGSFDEWYKYEHGFAATEFTCVALGAAAWLGREHWSQEMVADFESTARRAGDWLLRHEDTVKANHEMAAAAALAVLGKALNEPRYLEGARKKFEITLTLRNSEGWFNEIAGMDLGYCSVILDYAMLYHEVTRDERAPVEMAKLFRFMMPFIHPDLTIPAEAGLCLNPYVSRLGVLLLSQYCSEASWFVARLAEKEVGYAGIAPYLADDLRLCRWSYLPLLTYVLGRRLGLLSKEGAYIGKLQQEPPAHGLTWAKEAALVAWRSENLHAVLTAAGGGQVKIYQKSGDHWRTFEDPIPVHHLANGTILCGSGYDRERKIKTLGAQVYELEVPLHPAVFFFPGLVPRLVLRVLGAVPGLAVWLRRGIDWYRKRNRTALNQSSAPVSNQPAAITLFRTVEFANDFVKVSDRFEGRESALLKPRTVVLGGRSEKESSEKCAEL